ncbi:hypothetical protein [Patulibacter sp. SYSU D01012]|uniref:hypothetical protein n=1 Tax=Patulibacter sp. SYSU D01012 TaxID=2817381 RepID=UPI001B30F7D4|nr:hypothetical protein [Patulibacter sp. SYSU D01012]
MPGYSLNINRLIAADCDLVGPVAKSIERTWWAPRDRVGNTQAEIASSIGGTMPQDRLSLLQNGKALPKSVTDAEIRQAFAAVALGPALVGGAGGLASVVGCWRDNGWT